MRCGGPDALIQIDLLSAKFNSHNAESNRMRSGLLKEATLVGGALFLVGAALMQFRVKGITDKKKLALSRSVHSRVFSTLNF
jgi:hypothetical protein